MEFARGKDVVDPEVRAYVSSLVTALGGSGADEDGRYVLGDDALACLRDLKKWLKLYDEKANRLDVARCLAESNLVGGDLLQILAAWPEHATNDRLKSKIALACLELLVSLTWPLEKDPQQMTVNHHRHIPYLQAAQLGYKRSIINYDGARILHTAVRCALPSMAEALKNRSTRDEGIIKLVLYFLRNMAMIAPPPNVTYEGDETEISRSTTIDTFDYQDIFHLLLTLSSTMGEDFNTQDVVVMEVIFHLVKGVDVEKLFMIEEQSSHHNMDELVKLRNKEASMLRSYRVNAPTRHNRFGAMAWLRRDDHKVTTVSGQAALTNHMETLAKMDSTKMYKPPRRAIKGENTPLDFDTPVQLTVEATKHLRRFVEDFLDSGFNPLLNHVRKAIDREAERILEYHPRQYFYFISWFLQAERLRRKSKKSAKPKKGEAPEEIESYALVASGLNQEIFVTLNRAMDYNFENKSWQDLSAAMKFLTQVLLTVQEMAYSTLEEDQEAAENILIRIFYEETTHERVANITRTYKDQGFGYLDSTTELAHNYMRVLEQYSKQNVDLQVRSRRRVRRKKKATKDTEEDNGDDNSSDESDAEDDAKAQQTSTERKFDFKRFAARFLTQGCIDTFVKFTAYYNDLRPEQLKRSHRFFYRVAFRQEMSVMLFRVDIVALLYKMIKGPGGLDPLSPTYKEWNDLAKQLLKRCIRKIQERPELVVEMLFSKTNQTAHYLEYGYEKQTASTSKPRAAAEMIVKGATESAEQIGVVVTAMLDRFEGELVQWTKSQLGSAEDERRSWEELNKALPSVEKDPFADDDESTPTEVEQPKAPSLVVKPGDDKCKLAMFKNGYLRLLMTLVGFERIGVDDDPDTSWIIPSTITADQLKQSHHLIKKFESSPPVFENGQEAADLIKRKSALAGRKRQNFDDESDNGIDDDDDGELLFEPGGPTARKKDALEKLKKTRRRRKRTDDEVGENNALTDEQLDARAEARRQREREKNAKTKSDLYVHDSDDEEDEERDRVFFEREEQLRQRSKVQILKELLNVEKSKEGESKSKCGKKKGKKNIVISDDDEEGERDTGIAVTKSRKRGSSAVTLDSDEEEDADAGKCGGSSSATAKDASEEEEDAEETPLSSPQVRSSQTQQAKRRKVSREEVSDNDDATTVGKRVSKEKDVEMNDDEDEDAIPVARPARQRVRSGFIVDSSDEE